MPSVPSGRDTEDTNSAPTPAKPVRTPSRAGIAKYRHPITGQSRPDEYFSHGGGRQISDAEVRSWSERNSRR